jgi:hypothetical protein
MKVLDKKTYFEDSDDEFNQHDDNGTAGATGGG